MEKNNAKGGGGGAGKRARAAHSLTKDPELEAEIHFAKENGFEPPRMLPSEAAAAAVVKKAASSSVDSFEDHFIDKELHKKLKHGRAERKARSRGVSGCSIKKDGGRFEYGLLDCDLDYGYGNGGGSGGSNSGADTDDEMVEYADYVCKYSEEEIRAIFGDFLQNGNRQEALDSLEKFCITGDTVHRMVKDLVLIALELHHSDGCSLAMVGALFTQMLQLDWVSRKAMLDIIEELVSSVDDYAKDLPKVGDELAVCIAKLVEQGVLGAAAVEKLAVKHAGGKELVKTIYADALAFINNRHLLSGKCIPCGGNQSLEVLSAQFKLILKEYIHQSNDKQTAEKRLSELKVPHFGHEFVYQASVLALEQMHDNVMSNLAELIKDMANNGTLADSCIVKGFTRLYDTLADLYLDLPAAYALALRWVDKCVEAGFLSAELAAACPKGTLRSRSRTLSQGPDGKLACLDEDKNDAEPEGMDIGGPKSVGGGGGSSSSDEGIDTKSAASSTGISI